MHAVAADAPACTRSGSTIRNSTSPIMCAGWRFPRPGDETELSRAIAHALERPLDLDRPPWECWVIEGLKGNRWAILMKIHHCLLDGNPAAHICSPGSATTPTVTRSPIRRGQTQVSQPPAREAAAGSMRCGGLRRTGRTRHPSSAAVWPGAADVADRPGHHYAALQHGASPDRRRRQRLPQVRCDRQRRRAGRHHRGLPDGSARPRRRAAGGLAARPWCRCRSPFGHAALSARRP